MFEENTHYQNNKNPETVFELYSRALTFATIAHQNQRRKVNNIPYIIHPIGVSNYAVNIGKIEDINIVVACLLHDTVEDTSVTIDDIEAHFGKKIKTIVEQVTDDKNLTQVERKRQQVINVKHKTNEAKIVKMCDTIYNLKDLIENPIWCIERVQGYFVWKYLIMQECKGINTYLEKELNKIFKMKLVKEGNEYPVLPCDTCNIELVKEHVEKYYELLSK